MKRVPKTVFPSFEQLEARITALERDARSLDPTSEAHHAIMKKVNQLRMYAEVKGFFQRWSSGTLSKS